MDKSVRVYWQNLRKEMKLHFANAEEIESSKGIIYERNKSHEQNEPESIPSCSNC